jgi:hypothetical protein
MFKLSKAVKTQLKYVKKLKKNVMNQIQKIFKHKAAV